MAEQTPAEDIKPFLGAYKKRLGNVIDLVVGGNWQPSQYSK